jgi:hypothetical protein
VQEVPDPLPVVVEQETPSQPEPTPIPEQFTPAQLPPQPNAVKKIESQHRYLQKLIKKMAESRGYVATIEQVTPDGNGRVDVSLERNGKKIAVEISVTTGDLWEAHNVEKCLAAAYDEVIVCSSNANNLQKIQAQLESKLNKTQLSKVLFFESQEVINYFDKQVVQETKKEKVVKGYRIKVEYET